MTCAPGRILAWPGDQRVSPSRPGTSRSMAREVLLPLGNHGATRLYRRKTQAEKEICCLNARTSRQRIAQAEGSGREQRRSARGAASRRPEPDGKDAEIAPGRPASLGTKTADQGLSASQSDFVRSALHWPANLSAFDRKTQPSAEGPECPSLGRLGRNSRVCRALARRFGRAAGLFPTAVFPGGRRV
jgi:hypothetical protein